MEVLNKLRKELKTIAQLKNARKREMEVMIDVYGDRIVVGCSDSLIRDFFERRQAPCVYDRGGWSIHSRDAERLGLNLAIGSYRVQYWDLRKNGVINQYS
jgi:hypothetical protein